MDNRTVSNEILNEIDQYAAEIINAVAHIAETDLADRLKNDMYENIHGCVYDAYTPRGGGEWWSKRRMDYGGLSDRNNFEKSVEVFGNTVTLNIYDNAPFQGTDVGYTTLSEVVDEGFQNFNMPFPRMFFEETESISDEELETIIYSGLARRGY